MSKSQSVQFKPFEATRLVTICVPVATGFKPKLYANAIVRVKPLPGATEEDVSKVVDKIRPIAISVRVLPIPKAALPQSPVGVRSAKTSREIVDEVVIQIQPNELRTDVMNLCEELMSEVGL